MNSHVFVNRSLKILRQVKEGNNNMEDDVFFKVLISPKTLTLMKEFLVLLYLHTDFKCSIISLDL